MKPKILKYITGILFILLLMQSVYAEITVSRDLPETATPSSEVTINLKLDVAGGETSGIIITEKIPEGVSVSSISNEGSFDETTREIKWLIYTESVESQTLTYAVAPSEAGDYTFSGTYTTLEEGVDAIFGDEKISVKPEGIFGIDIKYIIAIVAAIIILTLIFVLMKRKG